MLAGCWSSGRNIFGPTAQGYRCCLVLGNAAPDQSCRKRAPAGLPSNPHPPGLRHVVNPGRNCSSTQGQTAILSHPAEGRISTTVCNLHRCWLFPWGHGYMNTPTSLHHSPPLTLIKTCCDRTAIWFFYLSNAVGFLSKCINCGHKIQSLAGL